MCLSFRQERGSDGFGQSLFLCGEEFAVLPQGKGTGAVLTEKAFREAFSAGFTEMWQLEEYFDLPEADIRAALNYWVGSRGIDFSKQETE